MSGEKIRIICKNCGKCKLNPNDHWEKFPDDCLLSEKIFLSREKDMSIVRQAKEEILSIKVSHIKTGINPNFSKLHQLEKTIKKFEKYGSKNW